MKKWIAGLLVIALGLCLAAPALASENVKFKSSAYVYDGVSGQRTGMVIRKGSVAEYVDQSGCWAQVKVGKALGWVRIRCVMATGDSVKVVYSKADLPAPASGECVADTLTGLTAID